MNSGIRFGLWIFIVFIVGPTLLAQNTLTIEISGLQNARGNIVLELCDSDKNIVKGIVEGLQSNHCTLIISNLPTDTYSFRYFHDENKNSELDTRCFVIPREGFGFSNNAKGKFGPPDHQETLFLFDKDTTLKVEPTYY